MNDGGQRLKNFSGAYFHQDWDVHGISAMRQQMDLRQVEERLMTVLRNADGWLPTEQLAEMTSLVNAGEPGVVLENFCAQLEEFDVAVPPHVVAELKALASLMQMAVPQWLERGANA